MEPIDEKIINGKNPEEQSLEASYPEKREDFEEKELPEEDRIIREQLEKEVIKMRGRPDLEEEAKEEASKIKSMNTEERLKRLLDVAKIKGVIMAVRVCREMDDPYLLDLLHDTLASNGYYKSLSR